MTGLLAAALSALRRRIRGDEPGMIEWYATQFDAIAEFRRACSGERRRRT